jgi:GNAT superfamily N-acetyltransferase
MNMAYTKSNFEIHELGIYEWQILHSFWDVKPSWQNSIKAIEKLKQKNISIRIYRNKKLPGYTVFNPKNKRVQQLAVDKNYRRKGIGRQLLEYITTKYGKDISFINIDETSKETLKFMTNIGMNIFIKQHEMELNLK